MVVLEFVFFLNYPFLIILNRSNHWYYQAIDSDCPIFSCVPSGMFKSLESGGAGQVKIVLSIASLVAISAEFGESSLSPGQAQLTRTEPLRRAIGRRWASWSLCRTLASLIIKQTQVL